MGRKIDRLRPGLVERKSGGYVLTDLGLATVRECAALGMSKRHISNYLGVSVDSLLGWLDPKSDFHIPAVTEFYESGLHELRKRVAHAQQALMETNGAVAIHMGKQYLDQKEEEKTVNHKIEVVGTLPDFSATPEEWRRQFAPSALQTIEDKTAVEDAEYEEVSDEAREQNERSD